MNNNKNVSDSEIPTHVVFVEAWIEKDGKFLLAQGSFIRSSGHHVVGLSFKAQWISGEAQPLEDQEKVAWVAKNKLKDYLDHHWDHTLQKLNSV